MADTFLAAFRGRGGYDATQPVARPWLYGIASKLVARHRRAEARACRALGRAGVEFIPQALADQTDEIVSRLTIERLMPPLAAALAKLPANDRDALLLVAWADLTYEETALALGIPVGTVRSRLHRARRKLRDAVAAVHAQLVEEAVDHG